MFSSFFSFSVFFFILPFLIPPRAKKQKVRSCCASRAAGCCGVLTEGTEATPDAALVGERPVDGSKLLPAGRRGALVCRVRTFSEMRERERGREGRLSPLTSFIQPVPMAAHRKPQARKQIVRLLSFASSFVVLYFLYLKCQSSLCGCSRSVVFLSRLAAIRLRWPFGTDTDLSEMCRLICEVQEPKIRTPYEDVLLLLGIPAIGARAFFSSRFDETQTNKRADLENSKDVRLPQGGERCVKSNNVFKF